jgi:hypothetical protein
MALAVLDIEITLALGWLVVSNGYSLLPLVSHLVQLFSVGLWAPTGL